MLLLQSITINYQLPTDRLWQMHASSLQITHTEHLFGALHPPICEFFLIFEALYHSYAMFGF